MRFRTHISLRVVTSLVCVLLCYGIKAQGVHDTIISQAVIYNGDTIEAKTLGNIFFYSRMTEAQKAAHAKYNRLRNAVYVTYPYARRAGSVMNDINHQLDLLPKKSSRKDYIQSREKELKKEFSDPLTNLSVYQGKVLMKLINRETGNNCYEIIKEYKGGVTARLYQTVAFFFNSNLKQPYDAGNEDATIEKIVMEVQRMYGYQEVRKAAML
ncbi:MAG: DUF4294 domain-containing protein [Ferruginibacter sp.]